MGGRGVLVIDNLIENASDLICLAIMLTFFGVREWRHRRRWAEQRRRWEEERYPGKYHWWVPDDHGPMF